MRKPLFAVVALAPFLLAACGKEEPPAKPAPPAEPEVNINYQEIPPVSKDYPLHECVICGKPFAELGHPPYAIAYKAYEVRFCDKKCLPAFAKDPEGIIRAKINPKAMFDR